MHAHYGIPRYFAHDRYLENIYNARNGVYDPILQTWKPAKLTECGFQLIVMDESVSSSSSTSETTTSIDWNELEQIRNRILPRIEDAVRNAYGNDHPVHQILFWCPTLRLPNTLPSSRTCASSGVHTPRASYVSTAHIDTDVNAYQSLSALIDLIHKNRFPGTVDFDRNYIASQLLLDRGRRFSIVNAWQNIGNKPVNQAPLAFLSSRYCISNPDASNAAGCDTTTRPFFPFSSPDPLQSLWYTFPAIQPKHELLLFAQYDRNAAVPSDLWHCALTNMTNFHHPNPDDFSNTHRHLEPRQSFDVRCLVIFEESVNFVGDDYFDTTVDRLQHRRVPQLDFSASQQFCSKQAEKRRLKKRV
jgi:hypothetical protein